MSANLYVKANVLFTMEFKGCRNLIVVIVKLVTCEWLRPRVDN